jgi:hypothetical protein
MDVQALGACRGGWIAAVLAIVGSFGITASADSLDQITVQAQRDREKLKHEVDRFVSSVIVPPLNYGDTLWRWEDKICPLVAGLNKPQGEFVLARLSQIAKSVGAPLGSETCKPNFYVIVASDPELLLKRWWKRDPDLFAGEKGANVKRFLATPRPIRVWYSADTRAADGNFIIGLMDATSTRSHPYLNEPIVNVRPSFLGSRLTVSAKRTIWSVIIVVDAKRVGSLNFGQLTDYIGLIGLAQINLDKPLDDAPTILKLFSVPEDARPAEMTAWDRALLHGLYSTNPTDRVQTSQIQAVALKDITANATN